MYSHQSLSVPLPLHIADYISLPLQSLTSDLNPAPERFGCFSGQAEAAGRAVPYPAAAAGGGDAAGEPGDQG